MAEVTAMRNNALPFPVYGAPWVQPIALFDDAGVPISPSTPDSEISKNGDTYTDCTNELTEINAGMCYLSLTAVEMTADVVFGRITSAGALLAVFTLFPRKLTPVASGTAQGATDAGDIQLATTASSLHNIYNTCLCVATLDSVVEARVVDAYDGITKKASVTPDWNTVPDADDTYILYAVEFNPQVMDLILKTTQLSLRGDATIKSALDWLMDAINESGGAYDNEAQPTVQLANGVTHGGSTAKLQLGSSSGTAALQITNSAGNAVLIECSSGSHTGLRIANTSAGPGLYITSDSSTGVIFESTSGVAFGCAGATADIDANITGNLTGSVGSVTGAVGSVTGAVGSVTGAVGSVTGNVGGNIVGSVANVAGNVGGSVASVTGAVGSVTGNVGGNVVGSVGSIAAGGLAAASIASGALNGKGDWNIGKTGYALSAGGIQAIWDALTSALSTASSIGKLLVDNINATISSRASQSSVDSLPTANSIADQVWEEILAGHSGTSGSTAAALNAAGSAGDPWNTALPGAYGSGTAGKILGDNINATISSRASQVSVDDVPNNAEFDARTLAAAAYATAANQTTILSKTNLISASPAAVGSAMTLTSGERDAIAAAHLDLADGIETGLTQRQALRLCAAALAGKLSGAGTTTIVINNAVANTKPRITATVDASGNRPALTLDLN